LVLSRNVLSGAGGNASNQPSIVVIRELATGRLHIRRGEVLKLLATEACVGFLNALTLAAVGFVRVWLSVHHLQTTKCLRAYE